MDNHNCRALLVTDMNFVQTIDINQIAIYVYAGNATDLKNCRSIGGHVAILAGTAISYNAKWHKTISTSSTEAEFIQKISAAMMAKYLRMIMIELKIEQKGPMMIFEDSTAAMMMANASEPNRRTHHIDM
eukprot:5363563-Ditylum_brightwellii.AAC.1